LVVCGGGDSGGDSGDDSGGDSRDVVTAAAVVVAPLLLLQQPSSSPSPLAHPFSRADQVIMRFGKFQRVVEGGLYFTLPLIDTIIEHDMREITIEISPQSAVTRDNVYTLLSGVLFVQVGGWGVGSWARGRSLARPVATLRHRTHTHRHTHSCACTTPSVLPSSSSSW
jgi:hypothetical protein